MGCGYLALLADGSALFFSATLTFLFKWRPQTPLLTQGCFLHRFIACRLLRCASHMVLHMACGLGVARARQPHRRPW